MGRTAIKPNRGRRRRRLVVAIILIGLAIFFAPSIVATLGLHNRVLRSIIPAEAGSLTVRSASLGWFTPTQLGGLELRSHRGEVLLAVPTLTLDRTVANLLVDRDNLGAVSVQDPVLHVTAIATGSNLEEFIARFLEARDEPPSPITCDVDVQGGTLHVLEKSASGESSIAIEQLKLQMDGGELVSLRAAVSARQQPGATTSGQAGTLGIVLTTRADAARQLDVSADQWPLDVASPWLVRLDDNLNISGRLTGEASTVWSDDATGAALESTGTAALAGFVLQAEQLAGDRLVLGEVRVPWKLRRQRDHIAVDELKFTSDVGEIAAQGQLPLPTRRDVAWTTAALRAPPGTHAWVATGTLDLARVAAMLPNTLRIRDGVEVTSGRAEFSLQSRPGDDAHQWTGSLTVSNLAGRNGERALQWSRPVVAAASIRQSDQWVVESLTCDSEFLQIAAQGDRQELDAKVDFDLARLAAELGQLVELDDWQLGGRGSLRASWKPSAEGPLRAKASGSVIGLRFVDAAGRLFSEPSLQLDADVAFSLATETAPLTLDRGSHVAIRTDKDRATLRLDAPAIWPPPKTGAPPWQGQLEVEGDLARWVERLSPWIKLEPWRVGGTAKFSTPLEFAGDAFAAKALSAELANLQAIGPGWRMNEPLVTLKTSGRFDLADRVLTMGDTELIGTSVSLAARNTSLAFGADGLPQLRGEATFRAALERIDAWRIGTDGRPVPVRPAGMIVGLVRVASQPEGPSAELNANVTDLVIYEYVAAPPGRQSGYRPGWQEQKLEIAAEVGYRQSTDQWTIDQAQIRSQSLAAAVAGSVSDLTGKCEANIRGSIDYDLSDIGPVVAAALGLDMTMSGREQATFELVGPLRAPDAAPTARMVATSGSAAAPSQAWSRRLAGHASAGWESIHLFGLPIGKGRVEAQLHDGIVTLVPLRVSVGQAGTLTAAARARLAPPPRELVMPAGNIITDVEITPEVSDKLLKYFIPALADAIETQGLFSLATEGVRVPLDDTAQVQSAGKLTVHSVRVRPGRMGREWILLAEQIESILKNRQAVGQVFNLSARTQQDWLTIDEQVVDYRVENGRVHHENLVFHIGEIEVRSRGSVGFDQTLAIDIEIPVQDKWIEGRPWLVGFRGQTIKGTIRGTFGNIDRGTLLGDLSRQLLEGAAAGAIEEGLGRALDRLLRPRE